MILNAKDQVSQLTNTRTFALSKNFFSTENYLCERAKRFVLVINELK